MISQLRYFVVALMFVGCVSAAVEHIITGDFTETRKTDLYGNGYFNGKFYYYYRKEDNGDLTGSRLRLEYTVPVGASSTTIKNLYHYEYKALYSMCSVCKAESIKELPDPWWFDSNIYQADGSTGFYKKKNVQKTDQVSRIKMSSATSPSSSSLQVIEFYDGRVMTVSNVKVDGNTGLSKNSAVFSTESNLKCPTPSCSMLADMVFVLDSSGSVSWTEWRDGANFVIGVLDNFTFGETATAAAVVQFNGGQNCGGGSTRSVQCWDNKSTTRSRYYIDRNYSACPPEKSTPEKTASCLAGLKLSGENNYTVLSNKEPLITELQKTRYPVGTTCQAMGLELAMDIFDKSPRKKYGNRLNRVVIAVTDGDDYCPNRTKAAAWRLINDYNALYIVVGVGLECDYDRHFLENITSKLGGNPAYFSVNDYAAIKTIVDELFTPLCEEYHESECGPECKGLCACGDCFCPICNKDGNMCSDLQCVARDGTASGCVNTTNKTACPASDKCAQYTCQYNYATHQQSCGVFRQCDAVRAKNPGTCRSTTCKADGTCEVTLDNSVCKREHPNNMCEEWACAPVNKSKEDFASGEYNDVTGCYRVKNTAKTCKDKGVGKCVDYTCSMKTGECEATDKCMSDKCYSRKCPQDANGNYGSECEVTQIPSPDTKCTFYKCDPVNGFEVIQQKDSTSCGVELFPNEAERKCKEFTCDDIEGCKWSAFDASQCELCSDSFRNDCVANAQKISSIDQCHAGVCVLDDTASHALCDMDSVIDCTTSSEAAATRQMNNNNPSACFTIECLSGMCKQVPVPRKQGEVDDNCTKYVCNEYATGQWRWEARTTSIKDKCVTDACTDRVCVPSEGCVETDICSSQTDECTSYTCKKDASGALYCDSESVLKSYACMYERCNDHKKERVYNSSEVIRQYCKDGDICTEVTCSVNGECLYESKIDIEKRKAGEDDPCKVWSCNDAGEVSWRFKCDDGLYCTDDKCSFDGSSCRNSPINCYLEVNMTDYPCFRAECVEGDGDYRCVRKLKSGVYIDICGNCLRDYIPTSSDSESLAEADENCVEAPDDPMFKEGLAAASIALIVLGAIIIGGAMAASGVIGTKSLLERARAANNQSAHTNPLFEDNEAEMTNPAFAGDK